MAERVLLKIKAHSTIKHPNIVQMYGFFETENDICLVLEYAEEGKLTHLLKRYEEVPEVLISHYAYDIGMVLKYLQSRKIPHRDFKPSNVLLSNGVVKLLDFG